MLLKFDQVFREFEQEVYSKLREYFFDPNTELKNLNFQIEAQCLAEDIGYFSMILRELYANALDEISKNIDQSVINPQNTSTIPISLGKLGVAYKSFYFFIRAFHDAILKLILGIYKQGVSQHSSMKDAINLETMTIKQNHPVEYILKEKSKDYAQWFMTMRDRRNLLKHGTGVGYLTGKDYIENETTLAIVFGNPTKDQSPPLYLDEIIQALEMSIELTKLAISYGIENKRLTSPYK